MISTIEQVGGKKARIKNEVIPIESRAVAEDVLLDLAETINHQRSLNAKMDAEKLAVTARYQADLALCELQVTNMLARLENYATTHPEIFPGIASQSPGRLASLDFAKTLQVLPWPSARSVGGQSSASSA